MTHIIPVTQSFAFIGVRSCKYINVTVVPAQKRGGRFDSHNTVSNHTNEIFIMFSGTSGLCQVFYPVANIFR